MYGNSGPFSYSPRAVLQDNFAQHRRPYQEDDFAQQRRPYQEDDFAQHRRPYQQDDVTQQRRPYQQDDVTQQRRPYQQDDVTQQRRPYQQDNLKASSLSDNSLSRPSGRSIYMQRKEYSETLTRKKDSFQVRVEHLLTCELDGKDMKKLDDCLAKLKWLDTKGRLWGQEMILEVHGRNVMLSDIETKSELELLPLSSITQTMAILDSCSYNSLLTITVQDYSKSIPQVFIFQCDEMSADLLKVDLDNAVQRGGDGVEPRRDQPDIRRNLEDIMRQPRPGSFHQRQSPDPLPPPPQEPPLTQWRHREPASAPPPWDFSQEEVLPRADFRDVQSTAGSSSDQRHTERNTDIFNHVLLDVEIFLDKVSAAVNSPSPQKDNSKKKKLKTKKSKNTGESAGSLPPWKEYFSCLQKIKYGFNLLGQLDGALTKPSAPDYIHIIFKCLGLIVPRYAADLPSTVVSPLLTDVALRLIGQEVQPEERTLWTSLGESWNISRSRWPDEIVPYIPEFYDGWQPRAPSPLLNRQGQVSRSNSQRFPPGRAISPNDSSLSMRAVYSFTARNNRELSIMKGEVVQVLQKTKQWWLVSNDRNEQGNVPMNVLEPMGSSRGDVLEDAVIIDMTSSPAEVRAWLQQKGFSKITVSTLGVLPGQLLLGMTKNELKTVCPEEASKVFFLLQAIKSAIALASEPSGLYNGRY